MKLARIGVIGAVAAYVTTISFYYLGRIQPDYGYLGFEGIDREASTVIALILLSIMPSLWLPIRLHRPSGLVAWMLYLIVILPTTVVASFTLPRTSEELSLLILALIASFSIVSLLVLLPAVRFDSTRIAQLFPHILVLLTILFVAAIVAAFGVSLQYISFSQIYEVRADYKSQLGGIRSLAGYAVRWQMYVVGPALALIGARTRSPLLIGLAIVSEILVYLATGFKAAILVPLLAFGLGIGYPRLRPNWGWLFPSLAVVGVGAIGCWDAVRGTDAGTFYLIRRAIYTPGLLTTEYYQYFTTFDPLRMAGAGPLASFFGATGDTTAAALIAANYYGNSAAWNNANIWADGFANFGYPGMFTFSVLLGLLLYAIDCAGKNKGIFAVALLVGPTISLTNSGLLTVFLGHGLWLAVVLLLIAPEERRCETR